MKKDKTMTGGYYTLGSLAGIKGIKSKDPQKALADAGYRITYNYDENGDRFYNVTKKTV